MNNTSLKLLAKRARGRLQTAAKVTSEPTSSVALNASAGYMVVASIRNIEDDPLFAKVKRLIEREQSDELIVNPIAQLIDKSSFSTMTDSQKERYVLKLTKRYNEIYNYILSN